MLTDETSSLMLLGTQHMLKYFYRPIAFYNGAVLKCAGIANETNLGWFIEQTPGTIVLDGYRGDRIRADDHSIVTVA